MDRCNDRIRSSSTSEDGGYGTNALLDLLYEDLRELAAARMAAEPPDHTFQPTMLVHEVYIRLLREDRKTWDTPGHFFAAAAEAMRRVLVEHARKKRAEKRGGSHVRIMVDHDLLEGRRNDVDVLALNEALARLERIDPRKARIVVLRFFSGLTIEATAEVIGTTTRTVDRDWLGARTWLYRELHLQGGV